MNGWMDGWTHKRMDKGGGMLASKTLAFPMSAQLSSDRLSVHSAFRNDKPFLLDL